MAFQVLPILRTLGPLIADAGRIVVGLRSTDAVKADERLARLETSTLRAGEVLKGLAEQLQAVAQEMRVQAEALEAQQKKHQTLLLIACGALPISLVALGFALFK